MIDGANLVNVTLGEVTNPDGRVEITIEQLLFLGSSEANPSGKVDGPWVFTFTPGPDSIDSVDSDIAVDEVRTSEGITIEVASVHLSSSDIRVDYELTADGHPNFIGRSNFPVRMILPDGAWVGGQPSQDDPAKATGSLQALFPPLPTGVTSFELEFGPFTERVPGPHEIVISLSQGPPLGSGESVLIGSRSDIAGETLEVTSLSNYKSGTGYSLLVTNVDEESRTLLSDRQSQPVVTDSNGNSYLAASMGASTPENAKGEPVPGQFSVNFDEKLDSNVTELKLKLPSLVRLVFGSWIFPIQLP